MTTQSYTNVQSIYCIIFVCNALLRDKNIKHANHACVHCSVDSYGVQCDAIKWEQY